MVEVVPGVLVVAFLRRLPGRSGGVAAGNDRVDLPVPVPDRAGPACRRDEGVYSVIGYAFQNPAKERSLHVDQCGGAVISTYGYADYPLLAKTVAQGIALHEAGDWGPVNMWLTAAYCAGVIFLCVSGPLMWWRRRPKAAAPTFEVRPRCRK